MNGENSEDIDEIIKFFSEAYSNVDEEYLHPRSVSGNINPQEKNFSNELYTQMKILKEKNNYKFLEDPRLIIESERKKTDKKDEKELYLKQPDIIIHIPGSNENNLLVIEIKRIESRENIIEDLKKLKSFINKLNYKYGISLIFGEISNENGNIWNPIKNKIKEEESKNNNLKLSDYIKNQKIIILWCHKENHKRKCENISSFLVEGN